MYKALLLAGICLWPSAGFAQASDSSITKIIAAYENGPRPVIGEGGASALALPDVTPKAISAYEVRLKGIIAQLDALDPATLTSDDKLNADLLRYAIDEQLGVIRFDEARIPFNSDGGFDVDLIYLSSGANLKSRADVAAWLTLLGEIPGYYQANIDNAKRGIATRFTMPEVTVRTVLTRAKAAAAAPVDEDDLVGAVARSTAPLTPEEKVVALAKARELVTTKVRPVQAQFVRFLEKDYLPHARKSIAVTTVSDGPAYYAWVVKRYTTTDLTPDAIFDLGQSEVTRIRSEMDGVMRETGFTGDFKAFLAYLRSDPQFYATSREDLLEKASEIAKRIDDQLPAHFATLPRLTYGVRPVPAAIEEAYTTGRYFPGDPDKGIAGGLMINTSHLDQRALYELPALELHEGVPGHHLQGALAQENKALPAFRRTSYYSAFGEGWALYAEKLGIEMGIYRTPYERFGRLSYEMWRACRLVADTGMHAKGWTLAQAKACFMDNSALSEHNIDTELQRYISWPGQALSYKVGEIEILRLRKKAETALGDCFDERRFHDAVLLQGALPLSVLAIQIDTWIVAEKASAACGAVQ
jgi:uncharacterized protein (DUF885 family)